LARLARLDPRLLSPVQHRSAEAQAQLTVIRARAGLVGARTALVNAARGLAKSYGERLRKCGTQQDRRVQVTAANSRPNFSGENWEAKVDSQVAAPAETRTPNWH